MFSKLKIKENIWEKHKCTNIIIEEKSIDKKTIGDTYIFLFVESAFPLWRKRKQLVNLEPTMC